MSFYRTFVAAIAAFGLATAVFAEDAVNSTEQASADVNKPVQVAEASQAVDAAQASPVVADASANANQAQQFADANQQAAPAAAESAKVDLNKATTKQLAQIKGLTTAKARAIVAYRKKHGDFKSVDDLKMVKGFKKMDDKTFKEIQDQLTVG